MSELKSPRQQGTFAEGEADPQDHPEDTRVGTFAQGEEQLGGDSA
jgi:hypothetical protein